MVDGLRDADSAYAAWLEDFYPPNAIWRLAALQVLPDALSRPDAPASLKSLQRQLGSIRVD
ncbi:MAG: hypothetical protein MO852_15180 [Candidatus Devosia euplotis]|nr:hypothetical protein [Candidatus Devosia euplotis]